MTGLPFYQVDAFASGAFEGNPAAVIPLEDWLPDEVMQSIAAENNLSETAFTVESSSPDSDYELRWFTPTSEVELCGHATIASGHALMSANTIRFATRSGILTVVRDGDNLQLDLPAGKLTQAEVPGLATALGIGDREIWIAEGCNDAAILLLESEAEVRSIAPDFAALRSIPRMAVVTAPGDLADVVSRVFCPYLGIDEDPVTGSAHAALAPFWAPRLGRDRFTAFQASARGGHLSCELRGDRVLLGGACHTVITGEFHL